MRSQPNQVRLIIANLYIRVRRTRENADIMQTMHGMGSGVTERAKGAMQEAKSSLMLAKLSLTSADRPGPHLLMEIARRSAAARNAARKPRAA